MILSLPIQDFSIQFLIHSIYLGIFNSFWHCFNISAENFTSFVKFILKGLLFLNGVINGIYF